MRKKRFRPDKLLNRDDYCDPVKEAIYHALQPLDEVAVSMEEKWGVDRLVKLVSPDTAAKFGRAKAKLDVALDKNDEAKCVHQISVMIKGWIFLDREAVENGHQPISPQASVWRNDDGQAYAFVKDSSEAIKYAKQNPNVVVWTLPEVARLGEFFNEHTKKLGNEVKTIFPGATVRVSTDDSLNDEIPF